MVYNHHIMIYNNKISFTRCQQPKSLRPTPTAIMSDRYAGTRNRKVFFFFLRWPIVLAMYTGLNTAFGKVPNWRQGLSGHCVMKKVIANGFLRSTSKRKRLQIVNALSTESVHNSLSFQDNEILIKRIIFHSQYGR